MIDPDKFPHVHQAVGASCGVASWLMGYLHWKGEDDIPWQRERSLYGEAWLNLGKEGVEPDRFVSAYAKVGLSAELKIGATVADLKGWTDADTPVIVGYQAWTKKPPADWSKVTGEGHWSVVVGVKDGNIWLRDPSRWCSLSFIPVAEFTARWRLPVGDATDVAGVAIPIRGEKPAALEPVRVL